MDPIRPIGPPERDIEPVYRVERRQEQERREQEERKKRERRQRLYEAELPVATPEEGEDGEQHIDVKV